MTPSTLRFLVVEDEEFQSNMTVKILSALKVQSVHAAADGRQALELLKTLDPPPDIIVSDLDMPAMDGMEFMRHIGEMDSAPALIVASAVDRGVLKSVETMASAYG